MKNKHFARKQRQLKYLVKQLNILLQKSEKDFELEVKKIVDKIRSLVIQLNGIVSANRMKKILGTVTLLIGLSFSNTANAQYFAYPVTNPFSITPGYTNFIESVNLIDIDNDGDLDLFTDSMTYGWYSYPINFNFQENIGTPTNPNFKIPELNPFNLSLIPNDTSLIKRRHFVDLDGDGDFDVLSSVLYQEYYSFTSKYRYYENIGTPSAPNFTSAVLNPFGLQTSSDVVFLSIGDIDNDGDFDMISSNYSISSYTSSFKFIENTGSNSAPMFGAPQANTFGFPSSGQLVVPTLTDLDNDGDLDMIFGKEAYYGGEFVYFENTGTTSSAQFATATINPYGLTGATFESIPNFEFKDLDTDGDIDLLAGTSNYSNEGVHYFENVGVQQPVTYECINYSCVDPGTGNGSYATLSACQTSCVVPITYNCDSWTGTCWDPLDGTGTYPTLNDCQTNCIVPVTYDCDWTTGNCYDPGNGMGWYSTLNDCINNCQVQESYNCVAPGDCQDPGDGSGWYWSLQDCLNNCQVTPTWNCDATLGNCYDPGDGTGLYASLSGCQANCNTTSIENTEINGLKIYPNPVNNTLNVSADKKINKIEIYDALGRIIISETDPDNTINVKKLEKGIYSIVIIFDVNRITKRFTK